MPGNSHGSRFYCRPPNISIGSSMRMGVERKEMSCGMCNFFRCLTNLMPQTVAELFDACYLCNVPATSIFFGKMPTAEIMFIGKQIITKELNYFISLK